MKNVGFFVIFSIFLGLWLIRPPSCFAADLKIINYYYKTHFEPNERVTFSASIKNNDSSGSTTIYLYIILTNLATGISIDPAAQSGNTSISAGTTVTIALRDDVIGQYWTAASGIYSVSINIYDITDTRLDRVYGAEPVHVGTTKDSVAAFPKVLDLGTLQYGRYMHPVPLEINWDFYLRSAQIRKDHPWYMRIYTDNHKRYKGIYGAVYSGRVATQEGGSASAVGSPAGLVSTDGRYTIPLKVWCLNFGPDVEDGWDPNLLGPPPVKEDAYWKGPLLDTGKRDWVRVAWQWVPDYIDMTSDPLTWRRLIGQDPFDRFYVSDSNPTGDFTLTSPFQLFIAYETSPTAVKGKYSTDLIIEIYSP